MKTAGAFFVGVPLEKEYQVYILQSRSNGRYYCGYTGNLEQRLKSHNDPEYRLTRTTKVIPGPWEVAWASDLLSRSDAVKLEKRVKKHGIRRFLSEKGSAESRLRRD
ncbi:MAG: hypothetical protein COX19_13530 [Desulfobacterales bacterium CG23_combo_of_CG06-09_8_20_14_all_51_8]|nr:MAG: hypothetical protein COX19_13530 [Desulfobacterales bacterium CG23_combo_of_CG06-09_8_20_14_all_51_8]